MHLGWCEGVGGHVICGHSGDGFINDPVFGVWRECGVFQELLYLVSHLVVYMGEHGVPGQCNVNVDPQVWVRLPWLQDRYWFTP